MSNIVEFEEKEDTRHSEICKATYSVSLASAKTVAAHYALFNTVMETRPNEPLTNEQIDILFGVSYLLKDIRDDLQEALNLL